MFKGSRRAERIDRQKRTTVANEMKSTEITAQEREEKRREKKGLRSGEK